MGKIIVTIDLANTDDASVAKAGYIEKSAIRRYAMPAVVDTGSVMLGLPEDVVQRLGLDELEPVTVVYADDRKGTRNVAGPVTLRVEGREMITECVVLPPASEALIGQIILERLDLIADCQQQRLHPRPESPLRPMLSLK